MRPFRIHACVLALGTVGVAAYSFAVAAEPKTITDATATPSAATNAGVEVLTRGPIHEAFAQPVNTGGVRQLVVPKKPREAIEESPPDVKPANATWIGGYWGWNDGRKDFDWVSGVWRVPPPGQRWVAGYWSKAPQGYSRVAGFWTPTDQEQLTYYAEPPASKETGPTSAAPSADSVWVSGYWRWADAKFVWQPGFWTPGHQDWVWTPTSYYWTPRGWVACGGHWDYPLEQRGVLFAPVRFADAAFRSGHSFTPSTVLDSSLLTFYLFVRPSCAHYYFGDYYAAEYDGMGIYPWFAVHRNPGYNYDPLFAYSSWRIGRNSPTWARNLESWHAYYRLHPDQRLPHNLAAVQRAATIGGNRPDRQFLKIADSLQNVRTTGRSGLPLAALSPDQRARLNENVGLMRQFGTERQKMEGGRIGGTSPGAITRMPETVRSPEMLQLPRVARTLAQERSSRIDGTKRETMKPVIPTEPKELGPQQTPKNITPQERRERDKMLTPPPRPAKPAEPKVAPPEKGGAVDKGLSRSKDVDRGKGMDRGKSPDQSKGRDNEERGSTKRR